MSAADAAALSALIRNSRRNVRDFLPQPIEQHVLDAVLEDANWAPSWSNTQPYRIAVASGALRLAKLGRPVKIMAGGITGWIDEGFELATSGSPA